MTIQDSSKNQMLDDDSSARAKIDSLTIDSLSRQNTEALSLTKKEHQDTPDEGSARPEAETLGETFRQARLTRGLEQRDVAGRLRVKTSVIQAIESDDYASLDAPVFVRMYLQRYAQVLNLSEQDILARYKALGIDEPPPLRVTHLVDTTGKSAARWVGYPIMLAALAWIGWVGVERLSVHLTSPESAPLVTAPANDGIAPEAAQERLSGSADRIPAAVSLAVASTSRSEEIMGLAPLSVAAAAHTDSTPEEPSETIMLSFGAQEPVHQSDQSGGIAAANNTLSADKFIPASEGTDLVAEKNPGVGTIVDDAMNFGDQPAPFADTVAAKQANRLLIRADKDCWVEVKDDKGQRLAYGIFKAKTERLLTGKAPFSVTLGDATAVQIEFDGSAVKRSVYMPKRGTVSRFVLRPNLSG